MSKKSISADETKKDLISLLEIMPNISLSQNQQLCEMLYELKKKYNINKKTNNNGT